MSIHKLFVLVLLVALSCTQDPVLEGFDSQKWQEDADGCNEQRITLVDEILIRKAELVGLGQKEIITVFGKPNRHELYSRNKKAFIYFVENGPDCSGQQENPDQRISSTPTDTTINRAGKLVIRFNGIGRAKEIILYKNEAKD